VHSKPPKQKKGLSVEVASVVCGTHMLLKGSHCHQFTYGTRYVQMKNPFSHSDVLSDQVRALWLKTSLMLPSAMKLALSAPVSLRVLT
jgi:hypothetical protein